MWFLKVRRRSASTNRYANERIKDEKFIFFKNKQTKQRRNFLKKNFLIRVTFKIYCAIKSVEQILANNIQRRMPLRHVAGAIKNKTLK